MTGAAAPIRRAVVLFTRDLRLHDNPVLDVACRWAAEVIPVFVTGGLGPCGAGAGRCQRPSTSRRPPVPAARYPAGDYVRRYVPELATVPGPQVHQPWQLAGVRYPQPMATLTGHTA